MVVEEVEAHGLVEELEVQEQMEAEEVEII